MKTKEFVWQKVIDPITLTQLFSDLSEFSTYYVADEKRMQQVLISEYNPDEEIALPCIFATTKEDADQILAVIKNYPTLNAYSVSSWSDGLFDIHISHSEANKKHAMAILLEKQGVLPEESMVIGDGGNDLPLFELAGIKVAMGNAAEELKSMADWVAPSVDNDGLAAAIDKYIL